MGGCISQTQGTKKPVKAPKAKNKLSNPPDSVKQQNQNKNVINLIENQLSIENSKTKYKNISIMEILATYRIQNTLSYSTRMEGPKYLSNFVDGSSKVMRIYDSEDVDQERLQIYRQIIGFQVFRDQEMNFVIFDQFCSGKTITEHFSQELQQQCEGDNKQHKKEAISILQQVYDIIDNFHRKKQSLSCLNINSFKFQSLFSNKLRLVDFNISKSSSSDAMGFAHNKQEGGFQADWEFFGYLVKYLSSSWSPIFISHKMQYSSNDEQIISDLLKGKRINKIKISEGISFMPPAKPVVYGYAFRNDLNKLMKIRKKRKAHNKKYYDEEVQTILTNRALQEVLYRMETQRVMNRIYSYIGKVDNLCEQPFLMYSSGGQKFRRLKEVFLIKDAQKKMDQLRQILSTIR